MPPFQHESRRRCGQASSGRSLPVDLMSERSSSRACRVGGQRALQRRRCALEVVGVDRPASRCPRRAALRACPSSRPRSIRLEGFGIMITRMSDGERMAQREVVLRLDVLHLAELVRQRVEALDRGRLRAGQVAGDGAVREPGLRMPLDVVARGHEHLAVEQVGEVGEHPVGVDVHAVAVLVQVARGDRDVLGAARRAARGREHERVVGGEHVLLAAEDALDEGSSDS